MNIFCKLLGHKYKTGKWYDILRVPLPWCERCLEDNPNWKKEV